MKETERNILLGNPSYLTKDELQSAFVREGTVKHVYISYRDAKPPLGFVNTESVACPKLVECWVHAHVPTAQIEEITSLATTVLEDGDKAVTWLSAPNPATDNRAPIELIGESQGFERVKNLLLRIEYGVLA